MCCGAMLGSPEGQGTAQPLRECVTITRCLGVYVRPVCMGHGERDAGLCPHRVMSGILHWGHVGLRVSACECGQLRVQGSVVSTGVSRGPPPLPCEFL